MHSRSAKPRTWTHTREAVVPIEKVKLRQGLHWNPPGDRRSCYERGRQFVKAMRRGGKFPLIVVSKVGNDYLVADGHARLVAYRLLGVKKIRVRILTL